MGEKKAVGGTLDDSWFKNMLRIHPQKSIRAKEKKLGKKGCKGGDLKKGLRNVQKAVT